MDRYEEALERARKVYNSEAVSPARKQMLAGIFPQLRESEDEKIRKALLRCCDDWEKGQFGCMAKEDIPAIRAYLEKQKEPILEVFGFKVGDAVRLKDGDGRKHIIKSFEEVEWLHGPNFYHVEFEDNSARDSIYPGEQYSNGYYTKMEKIEEEQKPAKQSEEDSMRLEEAIQMVESNGTWVRSDDAVKLVSNWLKSLRPQPKAEWSEEDEEIRRIIINRLTKFDEWASKQGYTRDDPGLRINPIDWFKSLRPQPKQEWRNEDEAMLGNILGTYKTLEDMLDLSTGQDRDILESMEWEKDWLIKQLKSLRPQPKPEWSEEDETMWSNLIGYLEGKFGMLPSGKERYIKWLKDRFVKLVYPKPSWKPSEEQMAALKYALGEGGKFDKAALESLYNELQKLM